MTPIKNIRMDGGTQSRAEIHQDTVAEYAEAMADSDTVFPPVTLYYDGRDHWLADGFHRVAAAIKAGKTEIAAETRQGDRRRAILHSLAANSRHGLRRTNEDKRRAVTVLLEDEEWSQWSNREIARRCAVSESLVRSLREPICDLNADSAPRTVQRGGTTYQQNTAKIGGSKSDQETAPAAPTEQPAPPPEKPEVTKPDPHAKLRREFRALTLEAQEDDWIAVRSDFTEAQKRIASQRSEIADLKSRIKELTSADDAGRKIGNLQRRLEKSEGRSKEHQAAAARLQRQVNAQKTEIAQLRKQIENRVETF